VRAEIVETEESLAGLSQGDERDLVERRLRALRELAGDLPQS
jgi:hypothetical protein